MTSDGSDIFCVCGHSFNQHATDPGMAFNCHQCSCSHWQSRFQPRLTPMDSLRRLVRGYWFARLRHSRISAAVYAVKLMVLHSPTVARLRKAFGK